MFQVSTKNKKVLVALSGGVDSSVAAALLIKQGYQVEAAHMVCWDEGPYCTSDQDRAMAAKAASFLNIPFQVFDFQKEYKQKVINYFVKEYQEGRTPNPDVACNSEIKFGIFFKKALDLGFDYVATGHYARVQKADSEIENRQAASVYQLLSGVDANKDQSYFLYTLKQEHLKYTLFPIGHLNKSDVRQLAVELGLPNYNKPDSQGICFVGDVEIKEFLRNRVKSRIGNVVTLSGKVIGKHQGLPFYTIGQREGVGVSQKVPHYVVSKNVKANSLVVAPFGDQGHFRSSLTAQNVSWVGDQPLNNQILKARIRYRQDPVEGVIKFGNEKSFKFFFNTEQKAVTSGQAVVLYRDEEVVGGGTIV